MISLVHTYFDVTSTFNWLTVDLYKLQNHHLFSKLLSRTEYKTLEIKLLRL